MQYYEHLAIHVDIISQEFMDFYGLRKYISNKYSYAEVHKTVYGLPQAGKISHDELVKHLEIWISANIIDSRILEI